MDKEIKSLNQKIIELNIIIKKLKVIIVDYGSKKEKPKEKNELFCELYKSFSTKKLVSSKIYMIIGIYLHRYQKEMEKKYNNLLNKEKMLKKKIAELTEQLYLLKYGKKNYINTENYQIEGNNYKNSHVKEDIGENERKIQQFFEEFDFSKSITNENKKKGIIPYEEVKSTTKEIENICINKAE